MSSTGVIGRYLPMNAIKAGIAEACGKLSADGGAEAARAIMTTDTVPKTAQLEVEIGGTTIRVGGMCKGSGMIHPNMGTLLAYITTDAAVESGLMGKLVKPIADRSFNQVTIDGDSSTNDTFVMLANGAAGNAPIRPGGVDAELLENALLEVARQLARAIAEDGEGASKLITVRVVDALSDADARPRRGRWLRRASSRPQFTAETPTGAASCARSGTVARNWRSTSSTSAWAGLSCSNGARGSMSTSRPYGVRSSSRRSR